MDVRQYYRTSKFLKAVDVREAPIRATIADVAEGKYGKMDLVFSDGQKMSLNGTNANVLAKRYGFNSEDWHGKEIKLSLGQTTFNGEIVDTINITPLSPSTPAAERKTPTDNADIGARVQHLDDMDDEIPF